MSRWSHDELREWLAPTPGRKRMRLALDHVRQALARLSNPELSFPSIHVAGTNGKGSLCVHLAARGAANGVLTGVFSSPHLVRVEERVRIDGQPISPEEFDLALSEVREAVESEPMIEITYYEKTMLVAMMAFHRAKIDRAIIETGLGGRLDATRCVRADLCAITTISEDHMEILGPTLAHVLREKAGIHREGTPLVMLDPKDSELADEAARIIGDDLIIHSPSKGMTPWEISRSMATEMGGMLGWGIDHEDPVWPGRDARTYQFGKVELILSAAHNYESILSEMSGLREPVVLIVGLTKKQDLVRALEPVRDAIQRKMILRTLILEPQHGRLPPESSHDVMIALGVDAMGPQPDDMEDAINSASMYAGERGVRVLVLGSIHMVGECVDVINRNQGGLGHFLRIHSSHHGSKSEQ
ncbi:MAG: bifunctional folylpolyglutamate synthase/dihydrofolate synthase [Candidatus Thalassarchaeaceae archaeon]